MVEILRETSYQLDVFYHKPFLNGGLTLSQILGIYKRIQKSKSREIELQAALHGVPLKKEGTYTPTTDQSSKVPMFGDPADYAKLSVEERESQTKRMMGLHKVWSEGAM